MILRGEAVPATTSVSLGVGWNLVSYLLDADTAVTDALASIQGKYDAVLGFHDGEAKSYYPELPSRFADLDKLRAGHGYWIHMTAAAALVYP